MSEYIYEHKPSGADHMGKPVELPTLVRREEIVRCRDCKHISRDGGKTWHECYRLGAYREFYVEPDCFCAWGERRVVNV